jgi:hypothetical protein
MKTMLTSALLLASLWLAAPATLTAQQAGTLPETPPLPLGRFVDPGVVDANENRYLTGRREGLLVRLSPEGTATEMAHLDGRITGLAIAPNQSLVVVTSSPQQPAMVYQISPTGVVESATPIEGSGEAGGIVFLHSSYFLIVDSGRNTVWAFDADINRAYPWLKQHGGALPTASPVRDIRKTGEYVYLTNAEHTLTARILVQGYFYAARPEVFTAN